MSNTSSIENQPDNEKPISNDFDVIQTSDDPNFESPFGEEEAYEPPKKLNIKEIEDGFENVSNTMNGGVHDTKPIVVSRIWADDEDKGFSWSVNRSESPNIWDNK